MKLSKEVMVINTPNGTEIERKFIVNQKLLPSNWRNQYKKVKIFQGYLSFNPETRIRKIVSDNSSKYFHTEKSIGDLERDEEELEISYSRYQELLLQVIAGINKIRYYFDNGLEADEYLDPEIRDLIILEKEFKNVYEAKNFIPPFWAQIEVTENQDFKNQNLAKKVTFKNPNT